MATHGRRLAVFAVYVYRFSGAISVTPLVGFNMKLLRIRSETHSILIRLATQS